MERYTTKNGKLYNPCDYPRNQIIARKKGSLYGRIIYENSIEDNSDIYTVRTGRKKE
jgi:hypothetical protein